MLIVPQYQRSIYPLPRLQGEDTLHRTDEHLEHEDHQHDHTHHVKQVQVLVDQHIVGDLADVYGGRESQNTAYQCAKQCLDHDTLVRCQQTDEL